MIEWRPNSPPQERFLRFSGFEGFYGGAAGGGKSESLLGDAAYDINEPTYRALLLRRTFVELKRSLIDRSQSWYPHLGAEYNKSDHVWVFPSGAQIQFGHCEFEGDERAYDGPEYQFIGFDESTSFTRSQYIYLLSRLRSSHGLKPRVRSASNPGGPGHEWVFERFRPWLDPRTEYTGPRARSGDTLYVIPDGKNERYVPEGTSGALARIFVRAFATDNPANDAQYLSVLDMLDAVERAQKKHGDWLIKPAAGLYFKRTWWKYLDRKPLDVDIRRRVRAWDFGASPEGDPSAGVLMADVKGADQPFQITDVERLQGTPAAVRKLVKATADRDGTDVEIIIPQDPGQAGLDQVTTYLDLLKGSRVIVKRPTGDKVKRAGAYSSQVEHGRVALLRADWNRIYIDEHEQFPKEGTYLAATGRKEKIRNDLVDASDDAFNELVSSHPAEYAETAADLRLTTRGATTASRDERDDYEDDDRGAFERTW